MFDKWRVPPYSNRRLPPDVVEGASILAQDSKGVVVLDITMTTRAAQASRPPLILGVLALGGAIFPLAFGIIRDEFPRERVAGAIALVSGILGIGGGLGIVLAGPILQHLSYHWLFWIPLAVTAMAAAAAFVFIPESRIRE